MKSLSAFILLVLLGTMGLLNGSCRHSENHPATQPVLVAAPMVIELQTTLPATDQTSLGEHVTERGKDGHHDRIINKISHPTITVFLPEKSDPKKSAVILCPGGGYEFEAYDSEGVDVARRFNQDGIAAFVLKYRLPVAKLPANGELPVPMLDLQRALRLIRSRPDEWNVDPSHVGVVGFSAGGHLAAFCSDVFDLGDKNSPDPIARQSCRPDFTVLIYPVLAMQGPLTHMGSRNALIGKNISEDTKARFSAEQQLTENNPPLFIVHAKDDPGVKVQNSINMAAAAKSKNVPCQLVLYEKGGHGFGLGTTKGEVAGWFGELEKWMRVQNLKN